MLLLCYLHLHGSIFIFHDQQISDSSFRLSVLGYHHHTHASNINETIHYGEEVSHQHLIHYGHGHSPRNNPPPVSSPASLADPAAPHQRPYTSSLAPDSPSLPLLPQYPHYSSPRPLHSTDPPPTPIYSPHSHTYSNNSAPTTPSQSYSQTSPYTPP